MLALCPAGLFCIRKIVYKGTLPRRIPWSALRSNVHLQAGDARRRYGRRLWARRRFADVTLGPPTQHTHQALETVCESYRYPEAQPSKPADMKVARVMITSLVIHATTMTGSPQHVIHPACTLTKSMVVYTHGVKPTSCR